MRRESAFEEARGMIGPAAWSGGSIVSCAACGGAADPCIAYGGLGSDIGRYIVSVQGATRGKIDF